MALREEQIGELLERLRQKSSDFRKPPLIVIGGYALRAYVPVSRYSRDCDFVIPRLGEWNIDKIAEWLPEMTVEAKEKTKESGFLRLVKFLGDGKQKIKTSLDFIEGEVRGRHGESLVVDEHLVLGSTDAGIHVGSRTITIRVPAYRDYFLLKLLSGRPSDIRDIAALVWSKGVPDAEGYLLGDSANSPDVQVARENVQELLGLNVRYFVVVAGNRVRTSFCQECRGVPTFVQVERIFIIAVQFPDESS